MPNFKLRDLLLLPNLISLSRLLIAPAVAVALSYDTLAGTLWALGLSVLAGISDGLDGYAARKGRHVTETGIIVDPIADKIFAAIVTIALYAYRELPLWLVCVVIGRDVLILLLGTILLRGKKVAVPSNLTGKYAFFAIVTLLATYTIDFQFGIGLLTPIVIALLLMSLIGYGRTAWRILKQQSVPKFQDTKLARYFRWCAVGVVGIVYSIGLYAEFIHLKN